MEYASVSEAPTKFHFWTAVSAIAGVLRRRVWLDMGRFNWFPNFYIILVAPPGWKKSSSSGIGMKLLRKVEGVNFGPDALTWQSFVMALDKAKEEFFVGDEVHTMAAVTFESGELGNFINPQDREMIDLLVTLWDGRDSFTKITKMSGNDYAENPWVNIIACTTPAWIAGNFPDYLVGGGFTSRCVFVVADKKEKRIAYPHLHVRAGDKAFRDKLVEDLEHISQTLAGPYQISPEALEWGEDWYNRHEDSLSTNPLNDDRFGGYLSRKQAHIHKLAMVLAASQRDELIITKLDLEVAAKFVDSLEEDMPKVFEKIGKTPQSIAAERMVQYVVRRGQVPLTEVFSMLHTYFPDGIALEQIVAGAIRAGKVVTVEKATSTGKVHYLQDPLLTQVGGGSKVPLPTGEAHVDQREEISIPRT